MSHRFRLYWFRETCCDTGTLMDADGLDQSVRQKILELAGEGDELIEVYLPFLDRREMNRKRESLQSVQFRRDGNMIRPSERGFNGALRDHAAELLQRNPVWRQAPREHHPDFFRTWKIVSLHLQNALRTRLLERYIAPSKTGSIRLDNRDLSYPVLVYAASRTCHGRPRTEFTYDLADPQTFELALRFSAEPLRGVLAEVEAHLYRIGRAELARRYSPIWQEDIRREIVNRPRAFLSILGDEATFINAVIELGTSGRMGAVKPFARAVLGALRNIHHTDLRDLAVPFLNEVTSVLERCAEERARRTAARLISRSARERLYRESSAPGTSGHYTPGSVVSPSSPRAPELQWPTA
jgi:hypothetical protein